MSDQTNMKMEFVYSIATSTEFNRLRSVLVGRVEGANHPQANDPSFENFFMPPANAEIRKSAEGRIPEKIIEEISEDLENFVSFLEKAGVQVFRPDPYDSSVEIKTPNWSTRQLYSLMPRDCLLVVGNTIIETPSPTRARYFETFPFRSVLYRHRKSCKFRWLAAPKPILLDSCYGSDLLENSAKNKIMNGEILFDGANCVRLGRDVFIDVNRSANDLGAEWLQNDVLGNDYRVHKMSLGLDHADVTLVPIRPGLLLIDPKRVNEQNLPKEFLSWDIIRLPSMPELSYGLSYPMASNGIGRNVLMLDPTTAVVSEEQSGLIKELERRRITVAPIRYRHGRTLGGSFHCVTLDLHREGDEQIVSYL